MSSCRAALCALLVVACAPAADGVGPDAGAAPAAPAEGSDATTAATVPTRGTRTQAMTTPESGGAEAVDADPGPNVAAPDMGVQAMADAGAPAPVVDALAPAVDALVPDADTSDANDAGDQRHHVLGQWCTRDFQCLSGVCTGTGVTIGVCCERVCKGECYSCTEATGGLCKQSQSRGCRNMHLDGGP